MSPKKRRAFSDVFAAVFFLTLFLTMGCGYHLRANGEPVGIKIESLSIQLMTSTASHIGFEADFTRVIREEFISHAKVPLVSREKAQAVLTGLIYDIKMDPLTYDIERQTVREYTTFYEITSGRRLRIKLDIKLTDRNSGRIIWHEKSMEEKASFDVEVDPLATRYNQREALKEIARRLAKRVYLKTMERF
ncbi:MAG: LPS assembly lipoprotein LptE [Thermodesulfobacteriota bacterium]|nr:LPS assembly lipoprotein LptE [Thermodesulfobacteriota bacterium]